LEYEDPSLERLRDPNNQFFELARSSARLTRWWAVPLLVIAFTFAGAPGALIPLESADESGLWQSALETAAFFAASFAPVALLIGVWVWRREKRSLGTLGLRRAGALRHSLYGFAFAAGLLGLGAVLLLTSGDATLEFEQSSVQGWIALAPALVVLLGWIVQGLTEEVMFRGWMLQTAGVQLGPVIGASFTVTLFTLAHVFNPGMTALAGFNIFLIGVLFTLLVLLEGGIWAASGFHIAWNWLQSNALGFKVSGLDVGGGSFVRIIPDESSAITGGDFGFEGSVAATVAIAIGILIVLAVASRSEGARSPRSL
jgi:hypothetical protein